ncbi:ATP-binding protein [Blastococcus aurantiacus]|uniref:ATP-binding protein n=1 Tax=Blastococcus aurantiacus TaxID=1550231 RepID=UPI0015A3C0EF|nr:helix-turn-helix domain-containing protein [Blastococcus aurantiacus]
MPASPAGASFAELLRSLRERAGFTQEELAERSGLTPHAISALERGARTRPYPHTVRALGDGLGLTDAEQAALRAAVPRRSRGPAGDVVTSAPAGLRPSALPMPPTALVGREVEVAELTAQLGAADARVVTLTGIGGVGKSRLAVEVAARAAAAFPDGVAWVPLAALTDPTLVIPAVGRGVGLAGGEGMDTPAAVAGALRHARLLLVVDNCEHLLDAVADLGELLERCPGVVLLATSRAALRLRGEQEHPVQPLAVPRRSARAQEVAGSPAGALFLARARAVAPAFDVDEGNATAVAQVCARLAGIPLALELAAAKVRLLSPAVLLTRLDAAMAGGGQRDLPSRQRTLTATLDWSYQLLGDDARTLLRRLGAFTGGFDLDAVEAVAGDGERDVLSCLAVLVEHSLVRVHPGGRYDLLEPVAQYARSLLHDPERDLVHAAHARHYLALAERAHDGYACADQLHWLARVELDEDDAALAVERSLARGDLRTAARLCWELQRYWWFRQRVPFGRRLTERVVAAAADRLAAVPDAAGAADLAVAANAAGCLALAHDDPEAAGGHWEVAVDNGRRVGDVDVVAHASSGLALVAMIRGDLAAAAGHLDVADEGAARGTRSCCAWLLSMCAIWRGTLLRAAGDEAGAVRSTERGLASARERGDRLALSMALAGLGHGALQAGDLPEARRRLEAGFELSYEVGDVLNVAHFAQSLVVVEVAAGEHECAATLAGAADALLEVSGSQGGSYRLLSQQALDEACGQARRALGEDAYDDAADRGRALELHELRERVVPRSGRLRVVEQRRAGA